NLEPWLVCQRLHRQSPCTLTATTGSAVVPRLTCGRTFAAFEPIIWQCSKKFEPIGSRLIERLATGETPCTCIGNNIKSIAKLEYKRFEFTFRSGCSNSKLVYFEANISLSKPHEIYSAFDAVWLRFIQIWKADGSISSLGTSTDNKQTNADNSPLAGIYACHGGHVKVCEMLVFRRSAAIQERSFGEGYVALHIAAMRGHKDCVELLLRVGAPPQPRTHDGDTPKDLAKDNGYYDLAVYLESFVVPAPKSKPKHWLHENVDREAAVALLYKWQCTDGLFLIRSSRERVAWSVHVLTMAVRNMPYHFQIKSKGDRWFYIDDGPLFETLPHLVDYYGALADGLPHQLLRAIQPNGNPPIALQYNTIPLPSPSIPNFNNHINTLVPQPPPKPPIVRRAKSLDTPDDDPNDYLKLEEQSSRQPPGRRQPPPPPKINPPPPKISPPPPRISSSKFNRPPPPLPTPEHESKPRTIINLSELEKSTELGQGEFGSVLRGVWRNPNGAAMEVALKTLHPDKITQGEQEFLREAQVMSGLNHPCIVKLLGVCLGPPLILVQELVSMGALLDYLTTFVEEIYLGDLKLWAAQIAWGMMYLEEKRFVHRDLATRNILLQSKNQIKISDFGLSRAIGSGSNYYIASKGGRWPVKW
ncbi:Tyrosine- kinase HTK16, partial [Paramuricea clavata]